MGEKKEKRQETKKEKELSNIRSNTNCWKMLPSKVYGGETGSETCRGAEEELRVGSLQAGPGHELGTGWKLELE